MGSGRLKRSAFLAVTMIVIAGFLFGNNIFAQKLEVSDKDVERIKTVLGAMNMITNVAVSDDKLKTILNLTVNAGEISTDVTYGLLVLSSLNEMDFIDLVVSQRFKGEAIDYFNGILNEQLNLRNYYQGIGFDIPRVLSGRITGPMTALTLNTFDMSDKAIKIFTAFENLKLVRMYSGLWRYFDFRLAGDDHKFAWEMAQAEMGWAGNLSVSLYRSNSRKNETSQLEIQFAGLYEKWGPYVEINKGIKEEFKQQLVKELGDEIVFAAEIYNENLAQKEKKGSVFSVIKSALTSAMDLIKKQIGEINNKIKEMANLGGAQVSQITIEYEPPAPETEEKKEEGRAEKKESPESVLSEFSVAEYSVLDINPAEESASEPADDLIEEEAVEKNEHQEPPELVDMEISEPPITETDREFCEKKIGSQPLKNSIVFDEIAWMGTKASAADEWIKLKNISEKGVNLTNWQILDKDQQIKIIFTDGKPVLSKGFYILERTDDNSLPDASADLIYTGSLNDTDEALYLFDAECQMMDEILASPNWPGGDKENRIAMKRSGNLSWQALPGETTVIFNYSAPPPPPSSDISAAILKILISEVKISPIGERFVELYNPNANEIDLTGWYIQRKTKTSDSWSSFITSTDFEAKIIQPGSYFLVASSSEADIFKGLTLTESNFLILKNAEREIIDEINWETVETGKSFGRKWFNDSQGYGDFEIQEPTPRARNESQAADAAIDGNPTLAVVINEIAWMGTKASAADEWIELYNNSSSTIDLDGWTLKAGDGTPSLTLSSSTGAAAITGGGFLLLERTGSNTTDITEDYIFTGGLSNSGENLELRDSSGVLIDLVDFSLGWPAGATTSAYISMERINPLISGTSSGNWANNNLLTRNGKDAEGNNINGTPRAKNSVSYSRTNIFSLSAFDEFPEINLTKLGSPYIIQADLTVPLGKNLTIEPGVILKFNNQKRMEIDGSLEAAAETADSIIFTSWKDDQFGGDTNEDGTSNSPFYGDWRGLYFKDSFGSKLNNILIKYGQENIKVEGGEISIEDSTISYSEYKGIWLKNASTTIENVELLDTNGHPDSIALLIEGGVSLVKDSSLNESSFGIKITDFATATIKNNSFAKSSWPIYLQRSVSPEIFENQASENAINGIVVDGGDIDSDVVWHGGNLPYVINEAKSIAESGSLTLEAGTVVKFKNEGYLNVYGRLIAEGEGTTTNPVVFTSIHDDTFGGDTDNAVHVWPPLKAIWRGIKFYNTAALSSLDGARIRYGGGGSWGAITQEADVAIEIKNSMIEESSWAIYSNEADCAKAFEKIKLEKTTFRANNINIYLPAPVDLQCELFLIFLEVLDNMEKMKFKFITLNLWFGGVLFDAILDFLKKENPDILACQEIYDSKDLFLDKRYRSFDVLKNELKYGWASFAPTFSDELVKGKSEQGNAIFSRFPIISSKTIFYDVPYSANYLVPLTGPFYVPRNLQQAAIKAGDIEFNIFNTQGIWGTDGKDNERRLKMGQIIAGAVKGKENAILAGDFNIEPATETIAKIKKHLKSVFENELTTSFNMKRKDKPGFAEAVADQVFASENIKVVEHYCPQADISDHLPLVCVFEV